MDKTTRAEILKDEYIMLQQFYEDIDEKGLNIKNWAITVAIASIGAGLVYKKEILIAAFFASIVFWYLEAHWRGLSHFFAARIKEIEAAFQSEAWKQEIPLQVYDTWEKEFDQRKDQTWHYMLKQHVMLPHVIIAAICWIFYFIL